MNSGERFVAGSVRNPELLRPELRPGVRPELLSPELQLRRITRTRRDIWRLEQSQLWHPTIAAYAEAVRIMRTRPASDPTSWAYQAAIHGNAVTDQWRNTCQHNTWFFLPWHRMYLYWFERICRAAIQSSDNVDATTKSNWALPYWNYDRGTPTNQLPRAFRDQTMPDGSPNPLYNGTRSAAMNGGGAMPSSVTSPAAALAKVNFTGASGGSATTGGFGGPQTGFNHGGGPMGQLENVPHGAVHVTIGGDMGGFNTAGLDPIFWLHHCNIDRLWEVWDRQTSPPRENPSSAAWTTNQVFHFRNTGGADVTQTSGAVVNTRDQLGYIYDQFAGPFFVRLPVLRPEIFRPILDSAESDQPARPAELIGASEEPVQLTGATVEARVSMSAPPARDGARSLDEAAEPQRVYLNVEEIRAEGVPGAPYEVFVNLPDDDESTDDNYNVGLVSLFGAAEASDPQSEHPEGLKYTFDITDLYRTLRTAGVWDEADLKVTFKPVRVEMPAGVEIAGDAEPQPDAPVTVGRISVFFE